MTILGSGETTVAREGTQEAVTIPYLLNRAGLPTELTYIITLATDHDTGEGCVHATCTRNSTFTEFTVSAK